MGAGGELFDAPNQEVVRGEEGEPDAPPEVAPPPPEPEPEAPPEPEPEPEVEEVP